MSTKQSEVLAAMEDSGKPIKDHSAELATYVGTPDPDAPITEVQNYVFRLVKERRGRVWIDGIDDNVLNPKTGKYERIWLINGAPSIWTSELGDILKNEGYVKMNRRSLCFEDNMLILSTADRLALEFVRMCRHLVTDLRKRSGSKFEFFEHDPLKIARARMQKELQEIEAIGKAKVTPMEDMKKHAIFLGIPLQDEFQVPKIEEVLRLDYMLRAKKDPDHFMKTYGSKEVDVMYLIREAIMQGLIDLGGQGKSAAWSKSGGVIGKIPAGESAARYLTDLALTNSKEGRGFLDQLQKLKI